ncbi:hypothetical protein LTR84_000898 [Exophiala bonariae]|uniref:Protein-lysine N-methyltransferase EFM4 n=1 Tax=Exophiala bonariae TaxID=1690606 RepID=A0AAV9NVK3_9EURO|nr:hypothetical protein LTR84_000898 [Exophiala bonariae]
MASGQPPLQTHPNHLDPSELGTKDWDRYYQNDLDNGYDSGDETNALDEDEEDSNDHAPPNPSELESWFDDVGAPAKTLAYLTDASFPLSPAYLSRHDVTTSRNPTVLDLGTGNGSALFSLRRDGGYRGRMLGVDYSRPSVDLARRLWRQYQFSDRETAATGEGESETISFETMDLIHDDPNSGSSLLPWWPNEAGGFDLVLDKGTFDAISLSSATVHEPPVGAGTGVERRVCELYPAKVARMVRPGGFLLVTSCNWTEEEVVKWFTVGEGLDGGGGGGVGLEIYGRIKYPVFQFGGQKGQGVASVCFRRVDGL